MKKVLLTWVVLTLLWSCRSIDNMSIDYLLPAEMSFPQELRRVAIVNNTVANAPISMEGQFTDQPDVNARQLFQKTQYLHGDGKVATEALAQSLADGDYFDAVIICDSALRANDQEERRQTLTPEEVNDLTQQLGVDFLLALERLELRAETKATANPFVGLFVANTDVKVAPSVRVYIPKLRARSPITKVDSIYWQGFGSDINTAVHELPNNQKVINESSLHAGEFIAKTFIPYWESDTRYYFSNGSVAMRDAAVYAKEDNWVEAVALWQNTFDQSKSIKKKMYAAFNLALGNEMLEDIDKAIEWVTKAQLYAMQVGEPEVFQLATSYLDRLNTRKKSFASVKMQMERFEEDF